MKYLCFLLIMVVLFGCTESTKTEQDCDNYVVGPDASNIRILYEEESVPLLILYDLHEEFPFEEYNLVKTWSGDSTRVERLVIYYDGNPDPIYDSNFWSCFLYYAELPDGSKLILIYHSLYPRGPHLPDLFVNGNDVFAGQNLDYPELDYDEMKSMNVLGVRLFSDGLVINSLMGNYLICHASYWSVYNYITDQLIQYGPDEWIKW